MAGTVESLMVIYRLIDEYSADFLQRAANSKSEDLAPDPKMAETADRIAGLLEGEAEDYRRMAAKWRGEH